MHRPSVLSLAIASAFLAGCANPVLQIEGAGYSSEDSPALKREPASMAESMQKLNHVRAKYHDAIRRQRQTSLDATTGLAWLGTAIVGATYGHASEAWIVGTAMIGGTTYGLTRAQLDARQVELWQQGIEALDCARRASLPLDVGSARQEAINKAIERLVEARDNVETRASEVSAQVDLLGRSKVPNIALVDQAVRGAASAVADADTAKSAGQALLDASRGRELSSAVDRVDAQVLRATENVAIDVSSVKSLVAGIGGFASIFVPGIDGTLGQAMSKWTSASANTKFAPQSGKEDPAPPADTTALRAALEQLATDMRTLASRQAAVKAAVSSVDAAAVSEALKGCNVVGVATALVLQPSSLEFVEKKADGKGVSVSGGTPPYEVSLLDPVAGDTVAIAFSGGMSDHLQVKVTAGVSAGTYTVAVKDNSTSHRVVTLPVNVSIAPTPSPASSPAPSSSPVQSLVAPPVHKPPGSVSTAASAPDNSVVPSVSAVPPSTQALWTKFAAALRAAAPTAVGGGVNVSVTDVKEVPASEAKPLGGLRVTLNCSQPVDPGKPMQVSIRNALSHADPQTFAQLQTAGAIERPAAPQLILLPLPACVK